jgi:hypothetical protein
MPRIEWNTTTLDFQVVLCEAQAATLLVAVLRSPRICAQGERIKFSPYHGSLGFELELDSSTTVLITVPFDRSGNRLNYGEVGNGKKPSTIEVRILKATNVNWFDGFDFSEQLDFSCSLTWDCSKEAPEAGFKEVIDGILLTLAATALFHWIPALTLCAPSESVFKMPPNFPAIMEFTKDGIHVSWNHQEDATKTFHSWNSIPGEPFNEALIDVLVSHRQAWLPNLNDAEDVINDVNE